MPDSWIWTLNHYAILTIKETRYSNTSIDQRANGSFKAWAAVFFRKLTLAVAWGVTYVEEETSGKDRV